MRPTQWQRVSFTKLVSRISALGFSANDASPLAALLQRYSRTLSEPTDRRRARLALEAITPQGPVAADDAEEWRRHALNDLQVPRHWELFAKPSPHGDPDNPRHLATTGLITEPGFSPGPETLRDVLMFELLWVILSKSSQIKQSITLDRADHVLVALGYLKEPHKLTSFLSARRRAWSSIENAVSTVVEGIEFPKRGAPQPPVLLAYQDVANSLREENPLVRIPRAT